MYMSRDALLQVRLSCTESSSYSERCDKLVSRGSGSGSKGWAEEHDESLQLKHRQSSCVGNGLEWKFWGERGSSTNPQGSYITFVKIYKLVVFSRTM